MAYSAKKVNSGPLVGDPFEFVSSINVLNTQGVQATVGTPSVFVFQLSDNGYVLACASASVPVNGDAGYDPGCIYRNTVGGIGNTLYVNEGSNTSSVWSTIVTGGSPTPAAANSTATLTPAQVATGYITSTSAAATTLTLPTGTLLGAYLNAVKGTVFTLYIDNTGGANTVTIAVAVNGILSALAVAASASAGLLTVPSGVTGIAEFTLMFTSATAYDFTRTA